MKLAVIACVAICLCLGSLATRSLVLAHSIAAVEPPLAQPAARAPLRPAEKRALATIDKKLRRKLRKLALAGAPN